MFGETCRYHTRWRPIEPAQSHRCARKGTLDRHPRIRRWERCDPSVVTRRITVESLVLCPMDTLPPHRCSPKTALGWWRCARWTRNFVLRCDPMAHDEFLVLRPVNAALPHLCGPRTTQGRLCCDRWTRLQSFVVIRWITVDGLRCTRRSPGSGTVRPIGHAEPMTTSDSPRAGPTLRGS